jgi:hypothetical protein
MQSRHELTGWIHVRSSALREVRYRPSVHKLDLRYTDGDKYEYDAVPRSKFRALLRAESKGKFVNEEIKPKHSFRKLPTAEVARTARR